MDRHIWQGSRHLISQHRPVTDRTLEIEFLDPGIEAFAVTFG
jgi:hypothetical protein